MRESSLNSSMHASKVCSLVSVGRRRDTERMPTFSQARCLLRTYTAEAGSLPTRMTADLVDTEHAAPGARSRCQPRCESDRKAVFPGVVHPWREPVPAFQQNPPPSVLGQGTTGEGPIYPAFTYPSHLASRFGSSTVCIRYSPNWALVAPLLRPVMTIFFSYWPHTSRALWSLAPCSGKPMCSSSIAPARIIELGSAYWARPSVTIRGALPWIASNIEYTFPTLAL